MLTRKKVVLASCDFFISIISGGIMCIMGGYLGLESISNVSKIMSIIGLSICLIAGMIVCKAYNVILHYATVKDYTRYIISLMLGGAIYLIGDILSGISKVFIFKGIMLVLASIGIIFSRIVYYLLTYNRKEYNVKKNKYYKNRKKTLIIGAGKTCKIIIEEMKRSKYEPVAVVDDNERKVYGDIRGVKVVGTTKDIIEVCKELDIEVILFAIPSCKKERKSEILEICSKTGCEVKVLPYISDLVEKTNLLGAAKKIEIEDLLGREPIVFESNEFENFISDKVFMVTGGGGSIGTELCRQIAKNKPKRLIILDIYENNAYNIQQELKRKYENNLKMNVEIASVRDKDKMEEVFRKYRPNVVFHAAAHKHVPLMEDNPEEAVKNNVFGTYNCARLAGKYNVEKFVLISTDKAVNPTNVMGATKRICEMIIQYMSQQKYSTKYCAVRFGNVLGSNGSVIPLFKKQIDNGGPVTITHPDIIRYFMTIPEAVSLVLKAGSMAKSNEIFVLDMGKPVKIVDLAEKLITLKGYIPNITMPIKYTGLRPGEKLYEELLMSEEGLGKTSHNKIFIGNQIHVEYDVFEKNLELLRKVAMENDKAGIVKLITQIVTTYKPEVLPCVNNKENTVDKNSKELKVTRGLVLN